MSADSYYPRLISNLLTMLTLDLPSEAKELYYKLLQANASLSRLFSDSPTPFLQYRVVENAYCRSFKAENLSRSDTAFDAQVGMVGVGLKTFLCSGDKSSEKVAEFNALAPSLRELKDRELAERVLTLRNERIQLAQDLYGIQDAIYHVVARRIGELILFDTSYKQEDISLITNVKDNGRSVRFTLGNEVYSFNRSKSTLFREFRVPQEIQHLPIDIIEDPFTLLLQLLEKDESRISKAQLKEEKKVILPLYSTQDKKTKSVPKHSGLNQWNANGRKRSYGEVYIPIPREIHKQHQGFFPKRDEPFALRIPTGEILQAKVCQDGSKALMTNPNDAIADWLLRRLFRLKEGELLTRKHLDELGFDAVVITDAGMMEDGQHLYTIDKAPLGSYETFIGRAID